MDVLILIVSHNGAFTIATTLNHCLKYNPSVPVLVIDNASTDDTPATLQSVISPRVTIKNAHRNLGVGAAFNLCLDEAVRRQISWLMILDQDSLLSPQMLTRLIETGEELMTKTGSVAMVCPTVRSRKFPDIIHYPMNWTGRGFVAVTGEGKALEEPISVDTSISSGSLYRVTALNGIGGFNEGYFIDFVDHDCHLRLKQAGYTMWWERRAELRHDLGKIQRMTPEGLWIEHEPFRYYYMARNMLNGYWRFGGLRAVLALSVEIWRHMARLRRYGTRSNACNRFIRKGVMDAVLGKMGPLPANN